MSIFAHNNLEHHILQEQSLNGNHYLWIYLSKLAVSIGAVYRTNHSNIKDFLTNYSVQLLNHRRALVFGDFNINLLTQEKQTKDYMEMIKENGFEIMNKMHDTYCTRESTTTKTIIDHICTNLKNSQFSMSIIESAMSDHKQLYFQISSQTPKDRKSLIYEAIDYDKLYRTIEEYKSINDTEYRTLENKLLLSIEKCKIKKKKIQNLPKQDWIKKEIISEINERNVLWQQLKRTPENEILKEEYRKKRNSVTNLIQRTKNHYYLKMFSNCATKPKKMWSLIKNLTINKIK